MAFTAAATAPRIAPALTASELEEETDPRYPSAALPSSAAAAAQASVMTAASWIASTK